MRLFICFMILSLTGCATGIGRVGSPAWLVTVEKSKSQAYYRGICEQMGHTSGTSSHARCMDQKPNKLLRGKAKEEVEEAILKIGQKFDYDCTIEATTLYPVQIVSKTVTERSYGGQLVRQGTGEFTGSCRSTGFGRMKCTGEEETKLKYVPDQPKQITKTWDANKLARAEHKPLCFADRISKDPESLKQLQPYVERVERLEAIDWSGGWITDSGE